MVASHDVQARICFMHRNNVWNLQAGTWITRFSETNKNNKTCVKESTHTHKYLYTRQFQRRTNKARFFQKWRQKKFNQIGDESFRVALDRHWVSVRGDSVQNCSLIEGAGTRPAPRTRRTNKDPAWCFWANLLALLLPFTWRRVEVERKNK